ncbi:hypothetical protein AZI86_06780 [Bdellovibrio bacteriovorus]|uniref:DUF2232 domain-containing protein n=1 Tax=Bdellovibrio bacteriovorus TaxID=959 RepID=A0A150WQG6_BDEBC|nr:DUF2232 domain-containing protein [Bdellovibrio bacteriovorus]KYG66743.1 hypothetical protein AZI86_06780 [Bdellovibrio bacteriovorus]
MKASPQKFITIASLSILLSMLTLVLGAPLLRVLRKTYGPRAFWILGLLVTGAAWLLNIQPLALFLGSVWMTLGAYTEFERKGFGWWHSGVLGVLIGSLTAVGGLIIVFKQSGINTYAEVVKLAEQFTTKVQEMNPMAKLDPEILIQQLPSTVVILLMIALGVGLMFERRVFSWLNLPHEKTASQLKLLEYRVPEYMVWVAMIAFLLTMVSFGGKAIAIPAVNIVNVCIVLYFFQGLAVLEVFLNSMKAGVFTRILTYIILVGQLLLVLSVVGWADYWLDFRRRIRKMMKPVENPPSN